MSGAFEPVEDVGASGIVDLVKRMSVRLLNSHCIALPVTADIGVIRVEAPCADNEAQNSQHRQG